jgi:hypothetical protein
MCNTHPKTDAFVESHSCAWNAQEWGTLGCVLGWGDQSQNQSQRQRTGVSAPHNKKIGPDCLGFYFGSSSAAVS